MAGCDAMRQRATRTKIPDDLKAIHLMYVQFEEANGRPPANAKELEPISAGEPDLYKSAYERLAAGEYKVAWGTPQNAEVSV